MPWQTGRTGLVRALRGSITSKVSPRQCPSFGVLSNMKEGAIIKLVELLIEAGYIDRDNDGEYRFLSLTRLGRDALDEDWLDLSGQSKAQASSNGHTKTTRKVSPDPDESDGDPRLLQALFQWNERIAQEKKLPSYCILNKKTIYELARVKPHSRAALSQINGIGPAKLADYGTTLLEIIAKIDDE
jgi:ATP-dependent DNA helicase RecQ